MLHSVPLTLLQDDTEKGIAELALKGVNILNVGVITRYGGRERSFFKSKLILDNSDRFERFVQSAHRHRLLVQAYLNLHVFPHQFYEVHREWAQEKEGGAPLSTLYGSGYSMCVNTGFARYCSDLVAEVAQTGTDIIFLDGPAFYPKTCYCGACAKQFSKSYGRPLPSWNDWRSSVWRLFLEFRVRSIESFLERVRSAAREVGKPLVYANMGNPMHSTWAHGVDFAGLQRHMDLTPVEAYQYFDRPVNIPIWLTGMEVKYAKSVSASQPVVVYSTDKHLPWVAEQIPSQEYEVILAQALVAGADVIESRLVTSESAAMWRSLDGEFSSGDKLSNVALVYSESTKNYFYEESQRPTPQVLPSEGAPMWVLDDWKSQSERLYNEECRGWYDALTRLHAQFDVVSDGDLDPKSLRKYELLILANTACMSKASCDSVRQFVKDGGNVVGTHKVSLHDEDGSAREDFALSQVFGVRYNKREARTSSWEYSIIVEEGDGLFRQIPTADVYTGKRLLPSPQVMTSVSAKRARVLAYQSLPMPNRFAFPCRKSSRPAITRMKYGRGKAIYLAGAYGAQFYAQGFRSYLKMIQNLVSSCSHPLLMTNAPEHLEIGLQRKGGYCLVTMVNYGAMRRPFGEVQHVGSTRVEIPSISCKSVSRLDGLGKCRLERKSGGTSLIIDDVSSFSLVRLEGCSHSSVGA